MTDDCRDEALEVAPHLNVYRLGQDLLLLGAEKKFVVRNVVEQAVIAALMAPRQRTDVTERLKAIHDAHAIGQAIRQLQGVQILVERAGMPRVRRSYWSSFASLTLQEVERRLARSCVFIESTRDEDTADIIGALAEVGLSASRNCKQATLAILVFGPTFEPSIARVVSEWESREIDWLPIYMDTFDWSVGPIQSHREIGTWSKTAARIYQRHPFIYYLNSRKDELACIQMGACPRDTARAFQSVIAEEIAKAAALKGHSRLFNSVMRIDLRQGSISWHRVPAHPHSERERKRVTAMPMASLTVETSGGWRSEPVLQTLETLREFVDPEVGLVSRVVRVGPLEADWLEVRAAAYRQVAAPATLRLVRQHSGYCFGKGTTAAEAEVSAIAEAIERNSLSFRGDEVRRRSTFNAFGRQEALPPALLNLASDRQLTGDGPWWPGSRLAPFDPDVAIDWTPARSLLGNRTVWLPTEAIYFDTPVEHAPYCIADSNGVAAGSTWEEAVVQGFLELIERDAHAIWWYNRLDRPRIVIDGDADHKLAYLVQCHGKLDRTLWFLDITHDARIPVVVAVSQGNDHPERLVYAVGAHFSATVAALRALTEVHQRLALLFDSKHSPHLPADTKHWLLNSTLKDYPHLRPTMDTIYLRDVASRMPTGMRSLSMCVAVAGDLGLDLLTVDITRKEFGFPVARVVVPGLRHYWPRFGPGRLYDVPVALNWRRSRTAEERLAPPPPIF